ncbi:hypothetical protein PM082_024658 [Marasmius tenuissimus]|nr:hypothetical protein PM082_024658 [Marasmius tenuissimus]
MRSGDVEFFSLLTATSLYVAATGSLPNFPQSQQKGQGAQRLALESPEMRVEAMTQNMKRSRKFGIQATKAAHDASGSTVVFNFEGGEYQTLIQHSFRVVYNFCSKGT